MLPIEIQYAKCWWAWITNILIYDENPWILHVDIISILKRLHIFLVGCGTSFTAPSGTITSPGYPNHYGNNLDCEYYITVASGSVREIDKIKRLIAGHYSDVIMRTMASQITSLTIIYSTVYSGADQRKHQSSASLAFVRGIHRWPWLLNHVVLYHFEHYLSEIVISWWRHQMETFSVLLAICAGIHRSPVNSPHKGQWHGALIFSLNCAGIKGRVNNREAGDLRRHGAHHDVIVMCTWKDGQLWILRCDCW